MIELSACGPTSYGSATPFARLFSFLSPAFSKTRVIVSEIIIFLLLIPFAQKTFSQTQTGITQSCNAFEAMNLILEGQRLADQGTREALLEALNKNKAAYDCFRTINLRMGIGVALFATGTAYSSLGQKHQAINAFLEASNYVKDMGDSSINGIAMAGLGLAYSKFHRVIYETYK